MKKLMDAYMAYKKITIPVTVLVAVLLVGGIVWGVTSTTSTDEPTVPASNSEDVKSVSEKKDTKKSSTTEKADQTTSDKKDETKASASGEVTDNKKNEKKDTSKKENASNKNEGSNNSSSNNSANNNQQTPAEPEAPKETYDSYNRPMSCSSTFFNTYDGTPAWKENGCVCYYKNGNKVVVSQATYDVNTLKYNNQGIRDCPVCGAELNFAYVSTLCDPSDEHYGTDAYSCFTCGYAEYRPHVHVPGCAEHGCPL